MPDQPQPLYLLTFVWLDGSVTEYVATSDIGAMPNGLIQFQTWDEAQQDTPVTRVNPGAFRTWTQASVLSREERERHEAATRRKAELGGRILVPQAEGPRRMS